MELVFAYPSPLCALADRHRMGSSAVWLPSPPPPSIMARDSLSRRYTIDSAFRISISGAAASIQSLDTGFPPRHHSLAFPSATPSFAVALVLYRFIRILMANSLPLALLSTWMVLAHSSPASLC